MSIVQAPEGVTAAATLSAWLWVWLAAPYFAQMQLVASAQLSLQSLARLDEALRSSPPGGPALSRLVLELASLGLEELAGNRELRRPGQEPETALSSKGTGG